MRVPVSLTGRSQNLQWAQGYLSELRGLRAWRDLRFVESVLNDNFDSTQLIELDNASIQKDES